MSHNGTHHQEGGKKYSNNFEVNPLRRFVHNCIKAELAVLKKIYYLFTILLTPYAGVVAF